MPRKSTTPKVRIRERIRNGKREVLAEWWNSALKRDDTMSLDAEAVRTERDKKVIAEEIADELANGRDPRTKSITIDAWLAKYLDWMEGRRAENTITMHREVLERWRAWLAHAHPHVSSPAQLRFDHFEAYQGWRKKQPKMVPFKPARDEKTGSVLPGQPSHVPHPTAKTSARTVNLEMSVLKFLCGNWSMDENRRYIAKNPTAKISRLEETEPELRPLPAKTDALIEAALRKGREMADEYALAFRFLAETGLRPSECFGALRKADIDWTEGLVHIMSTELHDTKTKTSRAVPINPKTLAALRGLVAKHPGELLFPMTVRGFQMAIKRAGRRAGLKVNPYLLRHTAATRMLRATGDLEATGKMLGHRNLKTTKRYSHLTVDDLKERAKQMWARTEAEAGIPEVEARPDLSGVVRGSEKKKRARG